MINDQNEFVNGNNDIKVYLKSECIITNDDKDYIPLKNYLKIIWIILGLII